MIKVFQNGCLVQNKCTWRTHCGLWSWRTHCGLWWNLLSNVSFHEDISEWTFLCVPYITIVHLNNVCLSVPTTNGQQCTFPFVYNGRIYYECTTADFRSGNLPWCGTAVFVGFGGSFWGVCNESSKLFL